MPPLPPEIAAYFPDPVLRAAADPRGLVLPSRLDSRGAVVFADVSGFTPMTEALASRGKEGGEALTGILNRFFGAVLEGHRERGGEALRFLGDAMVILFAADEREDAAESARRALAQAVDMQRRVDAFREVRALGMSFTLRMKIGLATGDLAIHLLGSRETGADFFPFGPALADAVAAEHHAEKGDVRLSPAAAELLLGRAGDWPAWPLDRPLPEPRPLPSDRRSPEREEGEIALFLPSTLVDRIRAGLGGFAAEIRTVTTAFVGFAGLPDPASPGFAPAIQAYYLAANRIVARHGGRLNRIDAGDKGNVLHLLFGAPEAHGDDEERCVRAAFDLRDRLPAELGLPVTHAIGINSGLVYCGHLGSPDRHEYTVMGDPVNLAARLMQASAPGEILVSAPTAARLRKGLGARELPSITVKGKSEPVRVFHPVQRSGEVDAGDGAERRFVGRKRELGLLGRVLARVERGEGGAVLSIAGDPGVGKSRLLAEWLRESKEEARVFVSAALPHGAASPFHPFLPILRDLLGLGRDGEVRGEGLVRGLDARLPGGANLAPLVAPLFGLALREPEWIASLEASSRKLRLFDLVGDLLAVETARRPLVVAIEDAQWIDPASRELLEHLARKFRDERVLLATVGRGGGEVRGWAGSPGFLELRLGPLSPAEVERFAASRLGVATIPESLRATLRERAQGNPYFVEEILSSLEEAGAIRRERVGRRTVLRLDATSLDVPPSLEALLQARIDRLPERTKMILKVASVVGQTLPLALLARVVPFPAEPGEIREAMDQLRGFGVEPGPGEGEYRFTQALARETAYENLLFETRREIHRAVAERVETESGGESGGAVEALAHHFSAAQVVGKAARYLELAGDRAMAATALDGAQQLYRRALGFLEATGHPRRCFEVARKAADGLLRLGRGSEAGELASRMKGWADAAGGHPARLRAALVAARAFELSSQYDEAIEAARLGLDLCAEGDPEWVALELNNTLWDVCWKTGRFAEALETAERNVALAERSGDPGLRVEALIDLANSLRQEGKSEAALARCDEAIALIPAGSRIDRRIVCLSARAKVLDRLGRREEMIASWRQGIAEAERFGLRGYSLASLRDNLGAQLLAMGRLEEARAELLAALDLWTECGSDYGATICRSNLGVIEQLSGNWSAAVGYHEQALAYVRGSGERSAQISSLGNLGEIALERGRLDEAERRFAEAVALARELGERETEGVLTRFLAEIALRRDDLRAFLGRIRDGLPLVEQAGMKDEVASYLRLSGILKFRTGAAAAGDAEFAEALALAREIDSPLHQVQVLRDWGGELVGRRPAEGRWKLEEARRLAKASGLGSEFRAIGRMLRRTGPAGG